MENSKVHLHFTCTKKFENMTPNEQGRFCAECEKTVTDFREIPVSNIGDKVQWDQENACGNFYAHQLDRPFGNWKDKIISFYQQGKNRSENFGFTRPIALFLLTGLLIVTGCKSRQLAGAYAYGAKNDKEKSPKTETIRKSVDN